MPTVKVMMVAGEASGDWLGGLLIAQLRPLVPGLVVTGVGGRQMREAGCHCLYDINNLSVVGLVEVVRRLPSLVRVFWRLRRWLAEERPALLVTIDLPDFNFRLAREARRLGIPVVHYVGPQLWAWRAGRADRLAGLLNHLMVLFPFEAACYAHTRLPVSFVGHPLVAATATPPDREEARRRLGVIEGEPLVALLPGSRHGEVRRLWPLMVAACRLVALEIPNVRLVVALADTLTPEDLGEVGASAGAEVVIDLRQGMTQAVLVAADAALVASGTATLEAALLATPMTVVYRVHPVTYQIARRVIRVPYIALANLVVGEGLVPERIQGEATPEVLAADVCRWLTDPEAVARVREGYQRLRERLAQADHSAAEVVVDCLRPSGLWGGSEKCVGIR